MKYCGHCGSPMNDDILYCQKCGAKFIETDTAQTHKNTSNGRQTDIFSGMSPIDSKKAASPTNRKGMRICAIVSAVLTVTSAIMAFTDDPSMIALTGFCLVFTGMFFILSKTPRSSVFLFGGTTGIKKSLFVGLSIILAFVLFSVLFSQYESTTPDSASYPSPYENIV